jgi:hypothetical protein
VPVVSGLALHSRDQAGYTDAQVLVACVDGVAREVRLVCLSVAFKTVLRRDFVGSTFDQAMVFMATDDNPHFLGEDSVDAIGRQVDLIGTRCYPNPYRSDGILRRRLQSVTVLLVQIESICSTCATGDLGCTGLCCTCDDGDFRNAVL